MNSAAPDGFAALRPARCTRIPHRVTLQVEPHEHAGAAAILHMLRSTDIFRHFNISQAADVLQLCKVQSFRSGEVVLEEGVPARYFCIVLRGTVDSRRAIAAGLVC